MEGYWCYIILLYINILLYYYILLYIYCYIIHIPSSSISSQSIFLISPSLPHLSSIPLLIYLSPILPHSRNTSRYLDRIINISSVLSKTLRTILTPHVLRKRRLSVCGVYLCWESCWFDECWCVFVLGIMLCMLVICVGVYV